MVALPQETSLNVHGDHVGSIIQFQDYSGFDQRHNVPPFYENEEGDIDQNLFAWNNLTDDQKIGLDFMVQDLLSKGAPIDASLSLVELHARLKHFSAFYNKPECYDDVLNSISRTPENQEFN